LISVSSFGYVMSYGRVSMKWRDVPLRNYSLSDWLTASVLLWLVLSCGSELGVDMCFGVASQRTFWKCRILKHHCFYWRYKLSSLYITLVLC